MWIVFCLFLGMLFGNLVEWVAHKYILHGLGKKKGSPFAFHWNQHHKNSRKNGYLDTDYKKSVFNWSSRSQEIVGLLLLTILVCPVYFILPWAYLGMVIWVFVYYTVHHYSHLNPKWAKKYMRWHYDHHLGLNQDSNYNVVLPIWDYIFGTRIKYSYGKEGTKLVDEK